MQLFWGETECACKVCLLNSKKIKVIKFCVTKNFHCAAADVSLKQVEK